MPIPVFSKLSSPFAASSRTLSGNAEGPAPKLRTRDVCVIGMCGVSKTKKISDLIK